MPVKEKPKTTPWPGFDDRQLRALTEAYGIDGVDALLPIVLDDTHASMLDVRSETSRKALLEHDRRIWFVKQLPWYADDPVLLARRHAAVTELADRTGLVPRLLSTTDGRTSVRVDGATFEITEYRRGGKFTGSLAQTRAAASALARLHGCALGAEPVEDYRDLVADHVRLAHEVTGNGGPATLLAVLDSAAAELPALLPEESWSRLPRTFTHGDYNPWNLVFGADNDVIAVVDHDNCDTGTRLRDLVEGWLTHTAVSYRGCSTSFAVPFQCIPDDERSRAFRTGYFGIGTPQLSADEIECLPGMIRAVHLELVALAVLRGEIGDESAGEVAAWQADPPMFGGPA